MTAEVIDITRKLRDKSIIEGRLITCISCLEPIEGLRREDVNNHPFYFDGSEDHSYLSGPAHEKCYDEVDMDATFKLMDRIVEAKYGGSELR